MNQCKSQCVHSVEAGSGLAYLLYMPVIAASIPSFLLAVVSIVNGLQATWLILTDTAITILE